LLLQHLLLVLGGQFPPKCPGQFAPKRVVSLRRNGVVTFIRISNQNSQTRNKANKREKSREAKIDGRNPLGFGQ
jgi:hypothetical protein